RALDVRLRQKSFRLRALESRMDAFHVVERLRHADPARKDGDVGDEGDVARELVALAPGLVTEDRQIAVVLREAEDRVERGALAGAVGTDQSEDAPFIDAKIDAVQRDRAAVGLAEAARFDQCHSVSAPLRRSASAALPARDRAA